MAEQILLQGKILGTEAFLSAAAAEGRPARSAGEDLLAGRSQWITLMSEVLPRALLAELGWRASFWVRAAAASSCWCCRARCAKRPKISCGRRRGRWPS